MRSWQRKENKLALHDGDERVSSSASSWKRTVDSKKSFHEHYLTHSVWIRQCSVNVLSTRLVRCSIPRLSNLCPPPLSILSCSVRSSFDACDSSFFPLCATVGVTAQLSFIVKSWMSDRRGFALDSAVAYVCREAWKRSVLNVPTENIDLRHSLKRHDNRYWKIMTDGLPLHHNAHWMDLAMELYDDVQWSPSLRPVTTGAPRCVRDRQHTISGLVRDWRHTTLKNDARRDQTDTLHVKKSRQADGRREFRTHCLSSHDQTSAVHLKAKWIWRYDIKMSTASCAPLQRRTIHDLDSTRFPKLRSKDLILDQNVAETRPLTSCWPLTTAKFETKPRLSKLPNLKQVVGSRGNQRRRNRGTPSWWHTNLISQKTVPLWAERQTRNHSQKEGKDENHQPKLL